MGETSQSSIENMVQNVPESGYDKSCRNNPLSPDYNSNAKWKSVWDGPASKSDPKIENCVSAIDTNGVVYCRSITGKCWYDGMPAGKPAQVLSGSGAVIVGEMPTCKYNKPKSAPPEEKPDSMLIDGVVIPLKTIENGGVSRSE